MTKIKFAGFLLLTLWAQMTFGQLAKGFENMHNLKWQSASEAFGAAQEEEAIFYKGLSLYKMSEVEQAEALYKSNQDKVYGQIGMGMIALHNGKITEAEALFNKAALKSKDGRHHIAVSQAYAAVEGPARDKGIEWAKRGADMLPKSYDYRILAGDAMVMGQDGGSAITQYEYAQDLNPSSALPEAKIARVYLNGKTYDMAKQYFDKSLAKDPNNLFALNYWGYMQYLYKKYDEAELAYTKIVEKGDQLPDDMAMLANVYFYQKNYTKCIDIIKQATAKSNKYNYLNRIIGYSYFEVGKPQEALNYLNNFVATQPKNKLIADDYEYLYKATLAATKDTGKALNYLEQAVDAKPDDATLVRKVADIYKNLGRRDQAIAFYTQKIEMPDPSLDDYFQLAGQYYGKKDYPNAEKWYTKVIEMSPNSPGTYYQRANVKLLADPEQKTASAREDFLKFVELTKDTKSKYVNPLIKSNLYLAKDAIKNQNNTQLAKQYLTNVEELDPNNLELIELKKFVK